MSKMTKGQHLVLSIQLVWPDNYVIWWLTGSTTDCVVHIVGKDHNTLCGKYDLPVLPGRSTHTLCDVKARSLITSVERFGMAARLSGYAAGNSYLTDKRKLCLGCAKATEHVAEANHFLLRVSYVNVVAYNEPFDDNMKTIRAYELEDWWFTTQVGKIDDE